MPLGRQQMLYRSLDTLGKGELWGTESRVGEGLPLTMEEEVSGCVVPGRGEGASKARATARDQGGWRGWSVGVTVRGAVSQPPSGSPPHGAHPSRLGLHTERQQRGAAGGLSVFCHMECRGRYGGQLEG